VRPAFLLYIAVGLGAAIGGAARWRASELAHDSIGAAFPWGTLFVNITGSFLIGVYAALTASGGRYSRGYLAGAWQQHLVMTGFCGGYTTFSIFSLETLRLIESGDAALAAANIGVSVIAWLLAVWSGYALGRRM
jgi:fluoride exporter